jgi:head-tail adaptor
MTAGRRNTLITIERPTTGQATDGEETTTWAEIASEWAAVFYGRGDERRQAAVEQGQQPATFQVLANEKTTAVGLKDRIQCDGMWDIVGIAPDTPRQGEIEFTAVRTL